MTYLILLGILAALQAVDVLLTVRLLRLGGVEKHPIILLFMRLLGDAWWLGKAALAAVMVGAFWWAGESPSTWFGVGLMIGVYCMTALTLHIETGRQKVINQRKGKR